MKNCIGVKHITMLKRSILLLFLAIGAFVCKAQTLKITDVKSDNDKMYRDGSQLMGKNLVVSVYDSNASIQLPGEKATFLRQVSDNHYFGTMQESSSESWTADLVVDKTLGVLTSAVVTIKVSEKGGQYRSATFTVTAKRF